MKHLVVKKLRPGRVCVCARVCVCVFVYSCCMWKRDEARAGVVVVNNKEFLAASRELATRGLSLSSAHIARATVSSASRCRTYTVYPLCTGADTGCSCSRQHVWRARQCRHCHTPPAGNQSLFIAMHICLRDARL
jgi:hypothetical protein